ncbi:MAG: DUF2959 domain-containing protein [Pseudohongiellaceae bacterium]
MTLTRFLAFAALGLTLTACQSAYYGTMERFGIHKRDILVDRVEEAQSAQEDGQEQFESALEQFRSVRDFDGGELQEVYNRLNAEFEASETAAQRIRDRVASVEDVAEDLFDEWADELELYSNDNLRRDSEAQLRVTRQRYERLMTAMRRVESSLDPVLDTLRDNVLYLRHNLNSRAIASLQGELDTIGTDVDQLIRDMQEAIRESSEFIEGMRS